MEEFVKRFTAAEPGFFAAEAAGLAWLAEADAVPVVTVRSQDENGLILEKLIEQRPVTKDRARQFGARLARLHDAGAEGFGWAPHPRAWFGPKDDPFPVPTTVHEDFTSFWVRDRLEPLVAATSDQFGARSLAVVREAVDVIDTGVFAGVAGQGQERASRVHGDLWSGNVMWTGRGATLIDPAAHGGHRLEDLAMLALFGAPQLPSIYEGYTAQHPLPETWEDDLPAHLFFALMAHVAIIGGGYAVQAVSMARRIIERAQTLEV
jgi:fructosamine-3-kinase